MLKPILALPASKLCVRDPLARSSKRQRTEFFAWTQLLFDWDESEQRLHDEYRTSPTTDASKPYQIPWLVPPASAGLDTKNQLMNSNGESTSDMMTTVLCTPEVSPQQQYATNCPSSNGARNYFENYCRSIVPHSSALPISGLLDATPPVLTKTKSLLTAVSKYVNSSKAVKRRHSRDERNKCCLCHYSGDDSDRTAIHTLKELKAFVHNDLVEMLRPIRKGISTIKTELETNSVDEQTKHLPPEEQPVPLQMVSGDMRMPNGGAVMSANKSSVLTSGSYFPSPEQQHSYHASTEYVQADHLRRSLPMLVEEFHVNPTEAQSVDEPGWYSEKLKEKNREIEALQVTVNELVGYQQKITAEFDKVKQHLCNQAAQNRPLSTSSWFFPDGRPTLYLNLLKSTCQAATAALDCFTTHFVAYSEARFHVPSNQIWKPNFRNIYFAKESHWTYALKAFFSEKMFVGFENESFMTDAASLYLDPDKLKKESYAYFKRASSVELSSSPPPSADPYSDPHFRTYCEQKFDSIVPDAILLQPGDYDENDVGERSFPTLAEVNLSKSFTAAAMKVWTLHKLCFSFGPPAIIFRARRGHNVDWNYMESVVSVEDDEKFIPKVGFMIAPGFRLRNSTVKSEIYLAAKARACQVGVHGHFPT